MARTFHHIIGPVEGHAHQNVRTPAQYLAVQAQYLEKGVPHEATEGERQLASAPLINFGQWVLRCACGNAPSVSVAWDLACCFECGAIYRHLAFPPDRVAIEHVLLARTRQDRNWDSQTETLADLIAQNITRGDEVPV